MSSNKPTPIELRAIATIAERLSELLDEAIEKNLAVQFGNVRLYDSNGEEIGWLISDDELSQRGNWFVYKAEDED